MTADKPTLSFQIRLFLSLVAFSCLLLGLVAYYLYHTLDQQLHRDLGARAQVQAREIALIPSLVTTPPRCGRWVTGCGRGVTPVIWCLAIAMPSTSTTQNTRIASGRR